MRTIYDMPMDNMLPNMLSATLRTAGAALLALLAGALLLPGAATAQELAPGASMPAVEAQRVGGGSTTLAAEAGAEGTVVIFWSNQCLWADRYAERVQQLSSTFSGQGISFVLINSNDPAAFPQESAEASREVANRFASMTYLRDDGSAAAEAFGAERTPHVFVFDGNRSLVYVGAVDDSPGDPAGVQEAYLRAALEALVAGQAVPTPQTQAFGCAIKAVN